MIALACALACGFLPTSHTTVIDHDWAGYAWVGPAYQQIATTLQVPVAQCQLAPWRGLTEYETGEWVGLDGYANNTVEQAGILEQCDPWGAAAYKAWYQLFPNQPVYATWNPTPGQTLTLSVSYTAGRFTLAVGTWTVTLPGKAQRNSAEVILEAPGNGRATLPTCPVAPVTMTVRPVPTAGRRYRIILHDSGVLAGGGRVRSSITPGPLERGQFVATWKGGW